MPEEKVMFEGMNLTPKEVEKIQGRRKAAQDIKDGIDIEHIHSTEDIVRVFKAALNRAETERELDKALD